MTAAKRLTFQCATKNFTQRKDSSSQNVASHVDRKIKLESKIDRKEAAMFNIFGKKCFQLEDTKGNTWYLHTQVVKLRNGNGNSRIYYFAKSKRSNVCEMPEGYRVINSPKTGMPMLKKK